MKPDRTIFPGLPGIVWVAYSLETIDEGTVPVVPRLMLNETVRFHIAWTVVGTVTVIESPTK